jgi:hypothetical protein
MKNQIVASCTAILLSIIMMSCSALHMDLKSLYIMKPLAPGTKLSIYLEDKSAFDMDIQNSSKDTLVLRRVNHEDQFIIDKKISIAVASKVDIEILNISRKVIKPTVRI